MMAIPADGRDGQAQLEAARRSADRGVGCAPGAGADPAVARLGEHGPVEGNFLAAWLVMTGANSAVGLRSMAARFPVPRRSGPRIPAIVEGEGDPVNLAHARNSDIRAAQGVPVLDAEDHGHEPDRSGV